LAGCPFAAAFRRACSFRTKSRASARAINDTLGHAVNCRAIDLGASIGISAYRRDGDSDICGAVQPFGDEAKCGGCVYGQ
jgi:hypothetical protein